MMQLVTEQVIMSHNKLTVSTQKKEDLSHYKWGCTLNIYKINSPGKAKKLSLFHTQAKDLKQSLFCSFSHSFVLKPPAQVLTNEMLIRASYTGVWRGEGFYLFSGIYSVYRRCLVRSGQRPRITCLMEAWLKVTSSEYHHQLCEGQFWFVFPHQCRILSAVGSIIQRLTKWSPAFQWLCSNGEKNHVALAKKIHSYSDHLECNAFSNINIPWALRFLSQLFFFSPKKDMSGYKAEQLTYLQAESLSKEMKQIMAWFGTLEQHTAGGNKGGGSNSALEPAGPEAGLQPISLTALFPTELFFQPEELRQEVWCLSSNHLSLGFTRLSPVYNHNIIIPTTSIDLFTVHFHWSGQMSSLGEALAKTDMMTPIRLYWYSKYTKVLMRLCLQFWS